MIQKNRYFKRSKLSEAKFRQIVRHFALDLTATECAATPGLPAAAPHNALPSVSLGAPVALPAAGFSNAHLAAMLGG